MENVLSPKVQSSKILAQHGLILDIIKFQLKRIKGVFFFQVPLYTFSEETRPLSLL